MQPSPSPSSSSRGPIVVLGGALLLIAGGIIALIAFTLGQATTPRATPTIASEPAAPAAIAPSTTGLNRLAVIDGARIDTVDPDGRSLQSFDPGGGVPTASLIWSRDGRRLIYSYTAGTQGRLMSAQPDGSDPRVLFEADRVSVPFYLYGSPDDAHVAFLITDPTNGIDLRVAATDRSDSAQSIARGQPNYASWSPDSQSLLLHVGGTSSTAFVGTYHLGDTAPHPIDTDPAAFQAPTWSPTGTTQWLYAHQRGAQNDLVVTDGQRENKLTSFDNGIAFSWSPDGAHIAYALNNPNSFVIEALTITDRDGQHARVYNKGDLMAFFWSPGGSKLAYLTSSFVDRGPTAQGDTVEIASRVAQPPRNLELTWHVIDLKADRVVDLSTFAPTDSFLFLVQYFDQLAQSIAVWSPDSRSLVYTGTPFGGSPGVYVIDTQAANGAPRYVGPGDFAIWSWK
jgi:Tol biopolymer transport system component